MAAGFFMLGAGIVGSLTLAHESKMFLNFTSYRRTTFRA